LNETKVSPFDDRQFHILKNHYLLLLLVINEALEGLSNHYLKPAELNPSLYGKPPSTFLLQLLLLLGDHLPVHIPLYEIKGIVTQLPCFNLLLSLLGAETFQRLEMLQEASLFVGVLSEDFCEFLVFPNVLVFV